MYSNSDKLIKRGKIIVDGYYLCKENVKCAIIFF